MTDDVIRGLVAGGFGLAGTLIPAAISWTRDRDTASQRSRQLDEATKRVQFWDQWLKLSAVIDDSSMDVARKRVQQELATLCQILGGESASLHKEIFLQQGQTEAFHDKLHKLTFVRRALLLYRPARQLAWFPRFFFFFFIAEIFYLPFMPPDATGDDNRVPAFIGCVFLLVLFWYLSRWFEKPRRTSSIPTTGVPAPPPPPIC